ncbi:hypothetical protein GmHk_06G017405 [Glycine max]|nr:hypothetical protein GmHk_06G017405 [Glycine max]
MEKMTGERRSHRRYGGRQREEGIDGVKVRIRTFKGTRDPKVYLEWEMKVELNYNEEIKSQEATMARYLHGLNREIQDIVELHHYASLKDLIHQAIKVEQQGHIVSQCPNKRTMAVVGYGVITSASFSGSSSSSTESERSM